MEKIIISLCGLTFGSVVGIVFYTSFFVVATDDHSTMSFQATISRIVMDMGEVEPTTEHQAEEFFRGNPSEYKDVSYIFRSLNGDIVFSTNIGQIAWLKINQSKEGNYFITCFAAPENTTKCENFHHYIN